MLNIEWVKNHTVPLAPLVYKSLTRLLSCTSLTFLCSNEVSFRFAGNKILDDGTSSLTLGEFYSHYSTPSNAPLYLQTVPTIWKPHVKGKVPLLCFEMYINVEMVRIMLQ
jgi:hypothetical protein